MRKYFYELTFSVDDEEHCLDAYIGIYLTRQRVEEVKSQLIKQPGFCLYPDLFIVKRKWVEVEDPSAFKPGFVLYHLSFEYETYLAEEETYERRLKEKSWSRKGGGRIRAKMITARSMRCVWISI